MRERKPGGATAKAAALYGGLRFGPGTDLAVEPVEAGPILRSGILGLLHLSYVRLEHLITTFQGRLPAHDEGIYRNQSGLKDRTGGGETRTEPGGGLPLILSPIGEGRLMQRSVDQV